MGMPIFFNLLLIIILYLFVKFCISTAVLLITPTLWDWSLAWCGPFFISFLQLMDFILSAMENLPLSIGSGGSGAGPSQRPLIDLNLSPAPEPEPALPSELSEEEKREQKAAARSKKVKELKLALSFHCPTGDWL